VIGGEGKGEGTYVLASNGTVVPPLCKISASASFFLPVLIARSTGEIAAMVDICHTSPPFPLLPFPAFPFAEGPSTMRDAFYTGLVKELESQNALAAAPPILSSHARCIPYGDSPLSTTPAILECIRQT
jgi:hypothetical protein